MKKLLLILTMGFLVSSGNAATVPPADMRGQSLYTTDFIGAIPCDIDASTGTAAIICNSTGTNGVSIGPAVVYGVITSSISQADYLVLKDTTGIGNVSGYLAPQSTLTTLSAIATAAVVGNFYQNAITTINAQFPYPSLNVIKFPVPLQFKNGILMQVSAAPISNQGVARWIILWRPLNQTQSPSGY